MKRRYKLLLIIFIGAIITILIHNNIKQNNVNLVAIGDSFSLGYIDKNIPGISFNDYLFENLSKIDNYNNEFCYKNLTVNKLKYYLDNNINGIKTKETIKQVINQADILTIAIGIDEFIYYDYFTDEELIIKINNYLSDYEYVIKAIKSFYNNKIIIISIYPFNNISKSIIFDLNNGLKNIAIKYKIDYIDIMGYSINRNYYYKNNNIYLNYKAHNKIAKVIINQANLENFS